MFSFNEERVTVVLAFSATPQGIAHLRAKGVQVLISLDEPLVGFLQWSGKSVVNKQSILLDRCSVNFLASSIHLS